MTFSIGKVAVVIGKGDGLGIGIEFYFREPSVILHFLFWYLIVEKDYEWEK